MGARSWELASPVCPLLKKNSNLQGSRPAASPCPEEPRSLGARSWALAALAPILGRLLWNPSQPHLQGPRSSRSVGARSWELASRVCLLFKKNLTSAGIQASWLSVPRGAALPGSSLLGARCTDADPWTLALEPEASRSPGAEEQQIHGSSLLGARLSGVSSLKKKTHICRDPGQLALLAPRSPDPWELAPGSLLHGVWILGSSLGNPSHPALQGPRSSRSVGARSWELASRGCLL